MMCTFFFMFYIKIVCYVFCSFKSTHHPQRISYMSTHHPQQISSYGRCQTGRWEWDLLLVGLVRRPHQNHFLVIILSVASGSSMKQTHDVTNEKLITYIEVSGGYQTAMNSLSSVLCPPVGACNPRTLH